MSCHPVGFATLGCRPAGPNNSEDFIVLYRFVAGPALYPYGFYGSSGRVFHAGCRPAGPHNSENFGCLSFRGRAWLVLLLSSSRLGALWRARIIRKIVFLLCRFVAGPALYPFGFYGCSGRALRAWGADRRARIIQSILLFVVAWPGLTCPPVEFVTLGCIPAGPNNSEDFIFLCRFVTGFALFPYGFYSSSGRVLHRLGCRPAGPNTSEDFIFVRRFVAGLGLSPCWVLQASGADLRARIIRKILFSFVVSWPGRPCVPVGFFTHQRLACRPAGPNM